MKYWVAYTEHGKHAWIARHPRTRRLMVYWAHGRAPEGGFNYIADAKAWTEQILQGKTITWQREEEQAQ